MSFRMDQIPSSPLNSSFTKWRYDIFLSFRGKDTRKTFTDHLREALEREGIHTFIDSKALRSGEEIEGALLKAIQESRFFIIIFSKNYANSKWCLKELAEISKCKAKGRKVFPVFYHVDPSEVRNQYGNYGIAFADYENDANEDRERIQVWRTALKEAGRISGYHIDKHSPEAEVIKTITRDMICEIIGKGCVEDGLVNKESRLRDLKRLISESRDVLMVGIYGLGGTGKTAIARALYDEISCQFDGASFLANIREVSKKDGLCCLQERLFCDILLGGRKVMLLRRDNLMESKFCTKKVLIVLDDVNDKKQLELLAGRHDWFGKGSRIIITCRSQHLLSRHRVDESYEFKELDGREALALLCHHALTEEQSPSERFLFLDKIRTRCNNNPLKLKVAGSYLRGKEYAKWEIHVENRDFDFFKVSYEDLLDEEKDIFLDVACFFQGEYKDFVTKILEKHDFPAEQGVQVLSNRCLLTISEGKLWMDNSIQEMAWKIARKQAQIPGQPCRLWEHNQILHVLKRNEGIHAIEGISLDLSESNDREFSGEAFSEMRDLRLLKVFLGSGCVNENETYKVHFSTDIRFPSYNKLRYLHGHGYQLDSFPSNFKAEELLVLYMPYSSLKQIKGDEIHFRNLIVLDLSHSQQLETISNFSRMPNLEKLVLEGCRSLVKVDPSIVNLKKLSLMNLKDCKRLKSLPERICEFEFLDTLILAGCSRLGKLLGSITPPQNLRILHLGHCKRLQGISELPSSIEGVDAYNCTSMPILSWKTGLRASILQRIKMNPESAFSIVLPGNTIPDRWVTHKVTESSVTMKLQKPDQCSDDFLGFAVCLVFAPQAEGPQLNPEILCESNNFTFFYCCGEDSVESDQERGNNSTDEFLESDQEQGNNSTDEFLTADEFPESDQERGNNSTDHVWLAYRPRPRARADGCHPKEWKASFKVIDCEVKECAICIVLKTRPDWPGPVVELVQPLTGETAHSSLQNGPWLWFVSQGLWA